MTVSRRMMVVRVPKGKLKRKAPECERPQSGTEQMVGEAGRGFVPLATHAPEAVVEKAWWQKSWRPVVMLLVFATAGGLFASGAMFLLGKVAPELSSKETNYVDIGIKSRKSAHTASQSPLSAPTPQYGSVSSGSYTAGVSSASSEGAIGSMSEPMLASDESFMASSYVRRKVSLPNISGNCVVRGNGSIDVNDCLRRQQQ